MQAVGHQRFTQTPGKTYVNVQYTNNIKSNDQKEVVTEHNEIMCLTHRR